MAWKGEAAARHRNQTISQGQWENHFSGWGDGQAACAHEIIQSETARSEGLFAHQRGIPVLQCLIVVVAVASSLAAKVSQSVDLRCDGWLLVMDKTVGQGWEEIFPASETGPLQEEAYLLAVEEDVADEPPVPTFSGPILDAVDEQVAQLVHGEQGVLDEQDEEKGLLVLGRPS